MRKITQRRFRDDPFVVAFAEFIAKRTITLRKTAENIGIDAVRVSQIWRGNALPTQEEKEKIQEYVKEKTGRYLRI